MQRRWSGAAELDRRPGHRLLPQAGDLPDDFYDLFVIDRSGRLRGSVPLGRMLRSQAAGADPRHLDPDIPSVPVTADQDEVAYLFRDQNLVSGPVVDGKGRLLGVITVDDVVDVIDEEAEEDLLKMGGVGTDDMHANTVRTVRLRGVWLAVNLLTARDRLAGDRPVRGRDREDRGARRADADRRLDGRQCRHPDHDRGGARAGDGRADAANALRFIGKEFAVGGLNGIIFAFLMGGAVVLWYHDWRLGAVIGAAMICNLLAASLAGTLIPIGLQKFGVDPAVSSTVFLTTVTDVIGFLAFLGLATIFLL